MTSFSIVLNQLAQFFLMLMMGYILACTQVVHEPFLRELSCIITKCLLPVFIFYSTYNGNSREQVLEGIPVLALAAVMYLALAVVFYFMARCLFLQGQRAKVFQALFVFGNIGFVGIPLIQALYPGDGMLYVAIFSVVDQLLLWTYGIWLTDSKNGGKMNLQNFLNPAVIAIVLATICILTEFRLPQILEDTAATVGKASTATCMIYLGALFYFSDLRKVLKEKELYIGILIKMIFFPIMFHMLLRLTELPFHMQNTLVLISGLPTMTVIPMLAKNGGQEGEYAISVTMITLAVSLVTLPVISIIVL